MNREPEWKWTPPKFADPEKGKPLSASAARQHARAPGELHGEAECSTCGKRAETGEVVPDAISHREMAHQVKRLQEGNQGRGQAPPEGGRGADSGRGRGR